MVTMKLSLNRLNRKGIALIMLIIAIIITALIGVGVTSFVASKKATEDYPIYSYQAYLLANAGVEFAIRYAHDNQPNFVLFPNTYITQYASPCSAGTSTNWKKITLPAGFTKDDKGELYISLELTTGCSCTKPLAPGCVCILHSCGKYGAAICEIKLNNFQEYYY